MIKKSKRNLNLENEEVPSPKKSKKQEKSNSNLEKPDIVVDISPQKQKFKKDTKKAFDKYSKKDFASPNKGEKSNKDAPKKKFHSFSKNTPYKNSEKPLDWVEYKKKKKEVQLKRKQSKNLYELSLEAKKIGEKLRLRTLKDDKEERTRLTKEIHGMLGGEGNYPKLVLQHDMARIVQYLLKLGDEQIHKEISQELLEVVPTMLESKYAKFCVKRMLKYGDSETRSSVIKQCYGQVVKLASHAVSAAVLDYGYTTWASQLQKQHFLQEFFGDMYKQSKDNTIKHLKDTYSKTNDMKKAVLGATKANLSRILNKELLDSHLVQTVLMQFLQECNEEERTELISQLAEHFVVLSNSKEGSRAAMICMWQGTKKDRKTIIKSLKEHAIPLSKHEHGHCAIIAVLDSVDDTVLLNKVLLKDITSNALDLANDDWGRKVILSLVAPGDSAYFHPVFINELKEGRENSSSKKEPELRHKEILDFVINPLLNKISEEPMKWLGNNSLAVVALAILKAGHGEELERAFQSISSAVTDLNWYLKDNDLEVYCIEQTGLHMVLKKLIKHGEKDEVNLFSSILIEKLTDEVVEKWISSNRGCFVLVLVLESCGRDLQNSLYEKIKPYKKIITAKEGVGAKILLKKLKALKM